MRAYICVIMQTREILVIYLRLESTISFGDSDVQQSEGRTKAVVNMGSTNHSKPAVKAVELSVLKYVPGITG